MHIAGSGKQAGQWVTCPAEEKCRIGGTHTTATSLQEAKKWAGKSKIADLSQQDYIGFLKAKLGSPVGTVVEPRLTETQNNVTPATVTQDRPRVRRGPVEFFDRETADERDARYGRENNLDGKVAVTKTFSIRTRLRWRAFYQTVMDMNIEMPLDQIQEAAQYFHQGGRDYEFKDLSMRISKDKVEEFNFRVANYIHTT
jgi:hypothetical protein